MLSQLGGQEKERRKLFSFSKTKVRRKERGRKEGERKGSKEGGEEASEKRKKAERLERSRVQKTAQEQIQPPTIHSLAPFPSTYLLKTLSVLLKCQLPSRWGSYKINEIESLQ